MNTHRMTIEFTTKMSDPSDAAEMVGMTLLDYALVSSIKVTAEGGEDLFEDSDEDGDDGDDDE